MSAWWVLHVGDLQAVVAFQTALVWPALGVIISTVFILQRAIVIMEIGVFAAKAPSDLPQGQLRREEGDQRTGRREKGMVLDLGDVGSPILTAV